MSESYADLARNIIRDSIVSAIYVDDAIVEPYSVPGENQNAQFTLAQNMYASFRKEGKSIDFYKFRKDKNWQDDRHYLFKNRDLLILDWQLDSAVDIQQLTTIDILHEAVFTDSLHFVTVYTTTPKKDFQEIFYLLKASFCDQYNQQAIEQFNGLLESLDSQGVETNFFTGIAGEFKVLALCPCAQKEATLKNLKQILIKTLGDNYRLFSDYIKGLKLPSVTAFEVVGYCINRQPYYKRNNEEANINTDYLTDDFVLINNTIVQLSNKSDPAATDLFQFFTTALQKGCKNILTLISLEARNLLRVASGFVGKDADSILDAILYHQKEKREDFPGFLLGIIRNQLFSYFDYKYGKLSAVKDDFWEGYKTDRGIHNAIEQLGANEDIKNKQLLRLNVYYNEFPIKKEDNDILKFGDVFVALDVAGKPSGDFFLCITAHCDCLKPAENIKNNFYFVAGNRNSEIKNLLNKGDDGFHSYFRLGEDIIAVVWNPRPVVLTIPDNKIKDLVGKNGMGTSYRLKYITTLKESYAQRMANNSFAFAMRVGIDFSVV